MEIEKIKSEMMNLWEKTFGDSREYIKLVFDSYFNKEYIAYKIEDGKIVSALLAIPYNFIYSQGCLKGLYLCGLATNNIYRGKGIMSELIEEINNRYKDSDFAFSFLIPASSSLIRYYLNHGYIGGIYRKKVTILPNKNEVKKENNEENGENKKVYPSHIHLLKKTELSEVLEVIDFIYKIECIKQNYLCLQHTKNDLINVIHEVFISENKIYLIYDEKKQIKEILFIIIDEESKTCKIPKIYHKSNIITDEIFTICRSIFPQYKIEVYSSYNDMYEETEIHSYRNPGLNPSCEISLDLYGMVRIINENEILKFANSCPNNQEFSILIKHLFLMDLPLQGSKSYEQKCKCQAKINDDKIMEEMEYLLSKPIKDRDVSIEQKNKTTTIMPRLLPISISLLLD